MIRVADFLKDRRVHCSPSAPRSPAVSVILPTFARHSSGTLARAVESVLQQSWVDLELLVVDDGSTDGTAGFLRALQARDERVVHVRHDLNSGLPALRVNEGIELARGRFVAFQFDDDEWLPGALEALVERALGLVEPAVVFGSAEVVLASGERRVPLPAAPLDEVLLSFQNRLANNSVLIARSVFDRVGMYDCQVAMRRLCDWDLWMRLVRHIPFEALDRVVSRVALRQDGRAISLLVPFDLSAFRFIQAIDRDRLLTPTTWHSYELDSFAPGGVPLPPQIAARVARTQVTPFLDRVGDSLGAGGDSREPPFEGVAVRPRPLLWTSDAYYAPWAFFLRGYDQVSSARGGYKTYYQPVTQIEDGWESEADLLLLVRSITEPAVRLAERALASRMPLGYFLDDDLLHLHELGAAWDRLAPGQPDRESLLRQLRAADAVWTNPHLAKVIESENPRSVPHDAAVADDDLPRELRSRGESGRIRIGYVGGSYRREEFELLWGALRDLAEEYGDTLEFEFWGIDLANLPPLPARVRTRPFDASMDRFLARLKAARFDILLTPLLGEPRPRMAKSPSKYLLTAVAGALGIFSDVSPYDALPSGVSCLKSENRAECWLAALREGVSMSSARFDSMREAMIAHVRAESTTEVLVDLHEAACRAIEIHALSRGCRGRDGRPRISLAGFEGSARSRDRELPRLLEKYGISVAGCETGDPLRQDETAAWLISRPGGLPSGFEIAPASTIGAVEVSDGLVPDPVPLEYFSAGLDRLLRDIASAGESAGGIQPGPSRLALWVRPETGPWSHSRDEDAGAIAIEGWQCVSTRGLPSGKRLAQADLVLCGNDADPEWVADCTAAAAVPIRTLAPGEQSATTDLEATIRRFLDAPPEAVSRRMDAYREVRARRHPQVVANRLFAELIRSSAKHGERPSTDDGVPDAGAGVLLRTPEASPSPAGGTSGAERHGWFDVDGVRHLADRVGVYRPLSRLRWSLRRKRVLVLYDTLTVSTHLYYGHALDRLSLATGREWLIRSTQDQSPEDLYSFHAVIFQRAVSAKAVELLEAAKRQGCHTIYDADDNLLLIDQVIEDPRHPWRVHFGEARDRITALLAGVDEVKVYSPTAEASFAGINSRVTVVRPYHILDGSESPPPAREGPARIGFLGSYYKDAEFKPVLEAILPMLEESYPLQFEFFGFCPAVLERHPGVNRIPWTSDYSEFRRTLRERRWDVGLAPLRDLEFNRCKTDIRYREYVAAGIAAIVSDAPIYRDSVDHRRTGLVVPQEQPRAWREAILELAENPFLRRWLARQALESLKERHRIEDYVEAVRAIIG